MEQPDVLLGDISLELVGKFVYVGGTDNHGRLIVRRKKESVFDMNGFARTFVVHGDVLVHGDPNSTPEHDALVIHHPEGGFSLRVSLEGGMVVGGNSSKEGEGGNGTISIRHNDDGQAIDLVAKDRQGISRITLFQGSSDHKKSNQTVVLKSDGTVWIGGPGVEGRIFVWSDVSNNYVELTAVVAEHRAKINKLEAQVAMLMEALL